MFRTILFTGLLMGVAGFGPAVFFSAPGYWKAVKDEWFPARKEVAEEPKQPDAAGQKTPGVKPKKVPFEGAPVRGLAEVFNFNVTADWILRRWPRVTTGLSHLQLQGYRVPLVTGTGTSDLAGSLTYYFNAQHRVQLITFHGTTADTRKLVQLLLTRHRFTRRLTNDPGMFVYEVADDRGKISSFARIRTAGTIKSNRPQTRFEVDLVLTRPS